MLRFEPGREPVEPRAAATLLVLRDGDEGPEVFCVRRHAASAFMGGAVVFPGGKLDDADAAPAFEALTSGLAPRAELVADEPSQARALAVCACREALEEAMLLVGDPPPNDEALRAMRTSLEAGESFATLLEHAGTVLATDRLIPFARWVTPTAETRRYDARFYLARALEGQRGLHDEHETVSSVWSTPARMLAAFESGDVFLAPPTTRCLELLRDASDVDAALALAAEQSLEPICPELLPSEARIVLALPGDPEHSVKTKRVAGPTRFVMEDGRLISADP